MAGKSKAIPIDCKHNFCWIFKRDKFGVQESGTTLFSMHYNGAHSAISQDFSTTFKVMYQEIQGLKDSQKALEIARK